MRPRWGGFYILEIETRAIFKNKTSHASTCERAEFRKYEAIPFYKQKSSNILLLPHLLLKFSSNILQIEYQMLVLVHTDFRKCEATMGVPRHNLQTDDQANQSIFHLQT